MSAAAGVLAFLLRGGPAMFGLLVCSVLALSVVVERLLYLAQQHADGEALVVQIGERLALDDLAGAVAICERNTGMLPQILKGVLVGAAGERDEIVDRAALVSRRRLAALERNLNVIGTIAVIAPFVGLFGTVLGIIHAFDDIALKGNSSPAVVAAGVSEALITTAAGLFVAVISVVFFNYFRGRVREFRDEVTWAAEALAAFLHLRNTTGLTAADVARLVAASSPRTRTAGST